MLIPAGAVHRDPELYANPNEFDPEHFSVEEVETRETASVLGFGDGPRNGGGARFGKLQSHCFGFVGQELSTQFGFANAARVKGGHQKFYDFTRWRYFSECCKNLNALQLSDLNVSFSFAEFSCVIRWPYF